MHGGRAAVRVLRARAWARCTPISASHGQGIRDLVELALEPLHLPEPDDEADEVDSGVIKLAVAGRPNVGKSTLINTWLGEERLVAFDLPGTTRDAITRAVRAQRPALRADRHRGPAPQGQGVRGHREVLGGQDAAGHRIGQRGAAAARCDAGRDRPGRAHCGLHPGKRPRRGAGGQQVGCGGRLPARAGAALRSKRGCRFSNLPRCTSSPAIKRQGLGPVWQSIAQAHKSATLQDVHAGADAPAAGGGAVPERPSAPACSGPSCVTRTRAA